MYSFILNKCKVKGFINRGHQNLKENYFYIFWLEIAVNYFKRLRKYYGYQKVIVKKYLLYLGIAIISLMVSLKMQKKGLEKVSKIEKKLI